MSHGNMVERINKETGPCLRTIRHDKHKGWVDYIFVFNTFINEIPYSTAGYTPTELHLNRKSLRFWEEILSAPGNKMD